MSNVAPGVARHVPRPLAADGLARAQSAAQRRRAAARLRARRAARRRRCGGRVVDERGRGARARARASGFSTARPACGSYVASFKMPNRNASLRHLCRSVQALGGTGSPGRRARRHRSIRSRPSGRSLRARRRSARSRPSGRTQATRRSARRHRCLVSSCRSRRQKASKRLFNGSSDHQALDSASGGQGLSPRSPANLYFVPSVCVVDSYLCRLVPWRVGPCAQFLVACSVPRGLCDVRPICL